ncbi:hypothetical protein AURDEDRAFT_116704 [Auricularia subglabra TFB-10046 SS5]|uniref:LysM domain-containing protein n=1 Tax=Auricularia subglabra (strain TFB-10046 / SS5) TaxID=717982 RepID=J0D0E2_AURST|nr:hypothetical protein AURDEDRAFT_116704 [Auricularia subglabra TFB-10046 SS5]
MTAAKQQLCLSCSSSPAPKGAEPPFRTSCCERPICAACLQRTPRLREYSPCLACLAGTGAASRSFAAARTTPATEQRRREENMFVLGDDDEDEDEDVDCDAPPEYSVNPAHDAGPPPENTAVSAEPVGPPIYHVQRGDTLQGLAFRFGIDGRELCTLNKLPFSALSTTPHLLHTRRTITLPLSAKNLSSLPAPPTAEEAEKKRRERAEKRFQFVTKEVDWRVARTYVALAEDEDGDQLARDFKGKEGWTTKASISREGAPLEARAVDQYLDDEQWERANGAPRIQRFPVKV